MSMFEQAARLKLRFPTPKGDVTVEDLFDLPLTGATNQPNLDNIAKEVNRLVKKQDEEISFVSPEKPADTTNTLKLDILKHVIAIKVTERDTKLAEKKKAEEKQKIMEILNRKKDASLENASEEELLALLKNL